MDGVLNGGRGYGDGFEVWGGSYKPTQGLVPLAGLGIAMNIGLGV